MSTQTTNLGLTKPAGNERPRINPINENMDILDEAVGDVDVSQDGSLQEQVNALGESVSHNIYIGYSPSMGRINGVSASCRWCVVGYDGNSKFDLHLTISINSNTSQSTSEFHPITLQPILTAIGKTSFDTASGKVIAYSKTSGLIYDESIVNYALLSEIINGSYFGVSRVFSIDGLTGGWPTNNAVYQEGVILEADLYGVTAS